MIIHDGSIIIHPGWSGHGLCVSVDVCGTQKKIGESTFFSIMILLRFRFYLLEDRYNIK